jgi:hypothetical protein
MLDIDVGFAVDTRAYHESGLGKGVDDEGVRQEPEGTIYLRVPHPAGPHEVIAAVVCQHDFPFRRKHTSDPLHAARMSSSASKWMIE